MSTDIIGYILTFTYIITTIISAYVWIALCEERKCDLDESMKVLAWFALLWPIMLLLLGIIWFIEILAEQRHKWTGSLIQRIVTAPVTMIRWIIREITNPKENV